MKVIATGAWLYDGATRMPVEIVRLDYDFWYAVGESDGELEPGEEPCVNPDGHLYYVRYRRVRAEGSFWPDSIGYFSAEEAKQAAESQLPSPVTWS
jgi:hypothetical protein